MRKSEVVFCLTLKSTEGSSVYNDLRELNAESFHKFIPDIRNIKAIKDKFIGLGFDFVSESEVGLVFESHIDFFNAYFKVNVRKSKINEIKNFDYYTYECDDIIDAMDDRIEKIFLPKELFVLNDSMAAPVLDYYHLKVPKDVARVAGVQILHKEGYTGKDISVAMIDTGLYTSHPFFNNGNFSIQKTPAIQGLNIDLDERGHGCGMASVLLSVAPGIELTFIKACDEYRSFPISAFHKAVSKNPKVINCSWGTIGFEPHLYLEILNAINKGIICVFSAGNGSNDNPNSVLQTITHPQLFSIGGCYMAEDGEIEVSNLSSSYDSNIFDNRFVPDFCGICGLLPYGQLILFPTQPGSIFDKYNGKRDGTSENDGYFVSSGTSAAAAHCSGIIAVLLQKYGSLEGHTLKKSLQSGARNITKGMSYMRNKATNEKPDLASGYGYLYGEDIDTYFKNKFL